MTKPPDSLIEHKLASMHPLYTDEQFKALKADISEKGQKVAVILYRGKLVDGRHRLKAIKELNMKTIKCVELGNNLSIDEVKREISSTEIRRHQSPTQLAIKANALYEVSDMTLERAAIESQATNKNLKRVRQLLKMGRRDIIDSLTAGELIDITPEKNYPTPTDSLAAIITMVKRVVEKQKTIDDEWAEYKEPKPKIKSIPNKTNISSVFSLAKSLLTEDEIKMLVTDLTGEEV